MVGINQVLKIAWSIVNNSSSSDDKTRLQALALIMIATNTKWT